MISRDEFTEMGIEMSAFDLDELLGFECPLVSLERQIGDGDVVVTGHHHQQRGR
jgi:hypothetical protein